MANRMAQPAAELFSAALLLTMIIAAIAFRGTWLHPPPPISSPLYDSHPVTLSPGTAVIGDLQVLSPPGGIQSALSSSTLRIRGWLASAHEGIGLRAAEFFLNGNMVQPLDASSELRPDLARAFDRIEFYYAGWQAVIPILRGAQPHTLELRAVLSDGREFTLRQINLQ